MSSKSVVRSQNLLLEHHGRVDDLILCKGSFTEANELKDEMQTLKGYGIKGAPRGVDPPVTVPLFYDFKPVAYDEPLLLVGVMGCFDFIPAPLVWLSRIPFAHSVDSTALDRQQSETLLLLCLDICESGLCPNFTQNVPHAGKFAYLTSCWHNNNTSWPRRHLFFPRYSCYQQRSRVYRLSHEVTCSHPWTSR